MRCHSPLSVADYKQAFRREMSDFFPSGAERFTGFTIGRIFYCTHHCAFEWDRRINRPKNAALGVIKSTDTGCQLHFLTFRGLLCPLQFITWYILMLPVCFLAGMKDLTEYFPAALICLGVALILLIYAAIDAFGQSLSDRSEESRALLLSFLNNPSEF